MKILILGKDGQVGGVLRRRLPEAIALGRGEADLEHPLSLGPIIERHRPDVIVNAAAYTGVDAAEEDRARLGSAVRFSRLATIEPAFTLDEKHVS